MRAASEPNITQINPFPTTIRITSTPRINLTWVARAYFRKSRWLRGSRDIKQPLSSTNKRGLKCCPGGMKA